MLSCLNYRTLVGNGYSGYKRKCYTVLAAWQKGVLSVLITASYFKRSLGWNRPSQKGLHHAVCPRNNKFTGETKFPLLKRYDQLPIA